MNSSFNDNNVSTGLSYKDSFRTAVAKNVIVLALGIVINYINAVLIHTFKKHEIFYMNPRYILFIHLVVNDMIQLTSTITLFVLSYIFYKINVSFCCILITFAVFTTLNTPLNLAIMAVECCIAVCLPLRHHELCTVKKTYILIGWIWAMGAVSILPDVVILIATEPAEFFYSSTFCTWLNIFRHPFSIQKKVVLYKIYLLGVWFTLIFTYFRIFYAAKAVAGDAKKASKTILLHGFQLLLCMLTYIYHELVKVLIHWFPKQFLDALFVCYITVQVLPRFVSPIVYGLRDPNFRQHLKRYLRCAVISRTNPHISVKGYNKN